MSDTLHEIMALVEKYYAENHMKPKFSVGDKISYSGRVYDSSELKALVEASLEFWLTAGKHADEFEREFASFIGIKYCSLVNSGSSANLLAFMALTSPLLGHRQIKRGDEVITVAAGFPTTIAPILQYGCIPVFVDVTIPQYNIDVSALNSALSSKTKAVMIAHTLGNPFDILAVRKFCDDNNLWLVEDNCDALGSTINIDGEVKTTGSIGDIATSSFYPPHHITMGEGGAVYTNNQLLSKIVNSLRDWGRDCSCPPGMDDTCKKRFSKQFGSLPYGYDHKYVYSHFGYNLKATDMQAAIGVEQLKKLPVFVKKRRYNWNYLKDNLSDLNDVFIFPEALPYSSPSWFGFLLTLKNGCIKSRNDIVKTLENKGIQTRNLFGGNLVKHPCFDSLTENVDYRISGKLTNTDIIMNNSFWLGVYPGVDKDMLNFIVEAITDTARNS